MTRTKRPEEQEYLFGSTMTISVTCKVKATSLEKAVLKMREASNQTFCHQCADGELGEWVAGELSGEPGPITAVYDDSGEMPKRKWRSLVKGFGE